MIPEEKLQQLLRTEKEYTFTMINGRITSFNDIPIVKNPADLSFFKSKLLKYFNNDYALMSFIYKNTEIFRLNKHIDQYENFIRDALSGAFSQNIIIGEFTDIHKYDINSSYPAIVKEYKLPYGKPQYTEKFNMFKCGIYKVEVDLKKELLPYRSQFNGVIYPIGKFKTYATTEELLYIKQSKIGSFKILYGYEWEKKTYKKWINVIDQLYKLKTINKIELAKFLLNSFIGFLARKRTKLFQTFAKTDTGKTILIDERIEEGKPIALFPEITFYIISLARLKIFKIFHQYENDIIRISTDAIYSKKKLPLKTGLKIGEFKAKKVSILTFRDNYFLENGKPHIAGKNCNNFELKMYKDINGEYQISIEYNRFLKRYNTVAKVKSATNNTPKKRTPVKCHDGIIYTLPIKIYENHNKYKHKKRSRLHH